MMESVPMEANWVATALRTIPTIDEPHLPMAEVCGLASVPEHCRDDVGDAVLTILRALGVIDLIDVDGHAHLVRARSLVAGYLLASLAEYIERGNVILNGWNQPTGPGSLHQPSGGVSGPDFLRFIEQQRVRLDPSAKPIRRTHDVHILIKVHARRHNGRYLLQFDSRVRQYRLLGTRMGPRDGTLEDAAIRALEAELSDFSFDHKIDKFVSLATANVLQLSTRYGVLTNYKLTFLQLISQRSSLPTDSTLRWVTGRELLASYARPNGYAPSTVGLWRLARRPGGLDSLRPSLTVEKRIWLQRRG
jgi:hypothetical protein